MNLAMKKKTENTDGFSWGPKQKSQKNNKNKGVQSFYGEDKIKEIQIIIDYKNTYEESGKEPDGKWGPESEFEWKEWKRWILGK